MPLHEFGFRLEFTTSEDVGAAYLDNPRTTESHRFHLQTLSEMSTLNPSEIGAQAQCTPVERLVVNTAQSQPVRNLIRATMRVPFDVGSLQSQEFIFQTKIKAADGATILVRV